MLVLELGQTEQISNRFAGCLGNVGKNALVVVRNHPAFPTLSGVARRPGSGRRALTETDGTLLEDLGRLLEPAIKGESCEPLCSVCRVIARGSRSKRSKAATCRKHTSCPGYLAHNLSGFFCSGMEGQMNRARWLRPFPDFAGNRAALRWCAMPPATALFRRARRWAPAI